MILNFVYEIVCIIFLPLTIFSLFRQRSGLDVIAVALTDPSTNAVQPMSLPYREPEPLKRHKSIPALKSDSGPVSFFGQVPHLVVARDGKKRDAPSTYDGPKSLPIRKKSRAKAENAVS